MLEWVVKICIAAILFTVVSYILPKSNIRNASILALSFVFLSILIMPLSDFTTEIISQKIMLETEKSEIVNQAQNNSAEYQVIEHYKSRIKEEIEKALKTKKYICNDIIVTVDENIITGYASAPLAPNSPYSGFYFYASHLVEMCLEVFGWEPEAVTARQRDGQVTAIFHYAGFDAVCAYTPGCARYFVQLTGKNDVLEAKEIDLAPAYYLEAEEFVQMLRTGRMPYRYDQLMEPVFCMNAIEESYKTGKTVRIQRK